ncbi:MAG: SH3 domain-containing protein [Pseudomonadales bacterium]
MVVGRVRSGTGLNLREKPNGEKIDVLGHNEEVEILEEVSFFRIRTTSGQIGYVHGSYLEKMPAVEDVDFTAIDKNSVPSEAFDLVTFSNEHFVGEAVKVDRDFVLSLNRICQYAKDFNVKIWATSSTRSINNQVRGAIVSPASNSCHHIGHAIDMNLLLDGKLYNSKKLSRSNLKNLPEPIGNFIESVRTDEGLRWGGDFNSEDPVHIDDDFYRQQKIIYMAKLHSRLNQLNA